jgi:hypothetical protein
MIIFRGITGSAGWALASFSNLEQLVGKAPALLE